MDTSAISGTVVGVAGITLAGWTQWSNTRLQRQLAASGVNVVLVARRLEMLEEVGRGVAAQFGSPPRQTWQACPRRTGLDDDPKQ